MSINIDQFGAASKNGTVSVVDSGTGHANVVFQRFDPHTGARIEDEIQVLTLADVNFYIAELEAKAEALKTLIPQLQDFAKAEATRELERQAAAAKAAEEAQAALDAANEAAK